MTQKPEFSKVRSFKEQVSRSNIWGHHFVFLNTIFAIIVGSAYLYAAPETESFLSFVYLVFAWLGQMSFLGFLIYLIFFFPLSFIGNFKLYRVLSVVFALLVHVLLLVDAKLFLAIKAHLSWGVLSLMIRDLDFNSGLNFRFLYIAVPVIIGLEYLFTRLSTREIYRKQARHNYFPAVLMGIVGICFVTSHSLHIWADATGYEKITVLRSVLPAHYPMTAKSFLSNHGLIEESGSNISDYFAVNYPLEAIESDPHESPKNVITIMLNGLSYSDIDPYTTKNLFALQNEYTSYENHYLPYQDADDNIFAAAYGLPAMYKQSLLSKRIIPVNIGEMQHQEYQLRVFTSLNKKVLSQAIAPLAGAHKSSLSYLPSDKELFDNAMAFIEKERAGQHYLVSISTSSLIETQENSGDLKAALKAEDEMLGQFMDKLKEKDLLKNTLVLITSSQGNLNREEQETTYSMAKGHVPLIVLWPRNTLRGVKFTTVSSHFDIASTVGEEILGIKTPSSKYSIGNSLLKLADRDYFVTNMGASLLLISNNAVTVYRKNGRAYIEKDGEKTVIHPNLETLIQAMSELNRFKG